MRRRLIKENGYMPRDREAGKITGSEHCSYGWIIKFSYLKLSYNYENEIEFGVRLNGRGTVATEVETK